MEYLPKGHSCVCVNSVLVVMMYMVWFFLRCRNINWWRSNNGENDEGIQSIFFKEVCSTPS
jgi:hypothetical protein